MKHADLGVAIGVVMVVVMMVLPLPAVLLDVLITVNLAIALTIVLLSLYTQDALELSVFPSLLLFTTLFRLAINISVTRLILLHGDAGSVIQAFGSFVVGGNVVVGLVVFLIIVVIQFVVITNGAGRVAEVAARFTLDAMPGKQMAIDADLNAGLITDDEARGRRDKIQREADFYGAMDGASKFVKGDAIAGIIIVAINLLGGIVIGMLQQGMGFGDALSTFSLLSIGDGLVAQIPALLISTATGIIVTRAATDTDRTSAPTWPARCCATRGRCSSRPACSAPSASCRACRSCRSCCSRRSSPCSRSASATAIATRPPTWSRWRRPRRRRRCPRRPTRSPSRSTSTRWSWRSATA